jgi:hypothetical protein
MKDFKPERLYSLYLSCSTLTQHETSDPDSRAASDYIDLDRSLLYLQALNSDVSLFIDLTKAMKTEQGSLELTTSSRGVLL